MSKEIRKKLEKIYTQIDKLAKKGKDNIFEYHKFVDDIINKGQYGDFEQCLYYYYEIDISDSTDFTLMKKNTWKEILFQTNSTFATKLKKIYDDRYVYQMSYDIYHEITGLTISIPLTTTYSISSVTQSISSSISGEFIYLNNIIESIYQIDIFKTSWGVTNSTYIFGSPSSSTLIQSISTTQSSYITSIPISYGQEYQIKSHYRTNLEIDYKLVVTKNHLLGQIKETYEYTGDTKSLIDNKEYAKLMNTRKTYLEVLKSGYATASMVTTDDDAISNEQNLLNRYTIAVDLLLS